MGDPTRMQVRTAIWTNVGSCADSSLDAAADAVMCLLTEAPRHCASPERYSEYVSDLRSASRAVRSQSWPLEMGEWADKLADRLARYADEPRAAEAPQPRVLYRGEVDQLRSGVSAVRLVTALGEPLPVPPGTPVLVIEDVAGTEATEDDG